MSDSYEIVPNGIFCSSCGKSLSKNAIICPNCGIAIKGGRSDNPVYSKDKTIAVLLAIFLSFWTWLYTYEKDAWKFWVGLSIAIVGAGIIGFITFGIGSIVFGGGIGIWAIIDVAVKPNTFYINYPNE